MNINLASGRNGGMKLTVTASSGELRDLARSIRTLLDALADAPDDLAEDGLISIDDAPGPWREVGDGHLGVARVLSGG